MMSSIRPRYFPPGLDPLTLSHAPPTSSIIHGRTGPGARACAATARPTARFFTSPLLKRRLPVKVDVLGDMQPPPKRDDGGCPDEDDLGSDSLLASAADSSTTTSTEFYSPIPAGYKRGFHKYVVVLGTVMSGLGKGIFAASVAKLMKDKGLVVAPIKLEGYLNIDAGTLNPYRHGEVFVLDDGTECDMDLGTYERMLDQDITYRNFTTSGQIFSEVLERERKGSYLGRDVQMIPHVTGEVKRKIRELALAGDGKRPADVVFVEVAAPSVTTRTASISRRSASWPLRKARSRPALSRSPT